MPPSGVATDTDGGEVGWEYSETREVGGSVESWEGAC